MRRDYTPPPADHIASALFSEIETARAALFAYTEYVSSGKLSGYQLYKVEWYPGIVPTDDTSAYVVGDILRVKDHVTVFNMLDPFELCGPNDPLPHDYSRIEAQVSPPDGSKLAAYIYRRNASVDGCRLISSGDWLDA